jgi:hypothetical protein
MARVDLNMTIFDLRGFRVRGSGFREEAAFPEP